MKNMNMHKKIVAALMAANGISAISDGNLSAMENVRKPLITMEKLHAEGKKRGITNLVDCVKPANPIPWTIHPDKLLTRKQLTKFLEDHKKDIFYAMYLGEDARIKAYTEQYGTNDVKKALDNWQTIGRGLIHKNKSLGDYNYLYQMSDETFNRDLAWSINGSVNCTQWASLIDWYSNSNGIPAKQISRPSYAHRLVLVPVRGDNKSIRLYTIDVGEHTPHLKDVHLRIRPLCNYDSPRAAIWEGLVDAPRARGLSYATKASITHNPPMEYLNLINDGWLNKNMPAATLSALVKGFLQEMDECQQRGLIKTNYEKKYRDYNVRICPQDHEEDRLYVPLNYEYLTKPNKKNNYKTNQYLVIGNKNKTTPMTMAEIKYSKKDAVLTSDHYIRIQLSEKGKLEARLLDPGGIDKGPLIICNEEELDPKKFISLWNDTILYAKEQHK